MGCTASKPMATEKMVDDAFEEVPDHKKELGVLLRTGAVRLVKLAWLNKNFRVDKKLLIRRQDMPEAAFAPTHKALEAIDTLGEVGVLSHGWLGRDHPDPVGARRHEIGTINDECHQHISYLFMDFLSLFQKPRTEEQDRLFKQALASMHRIYSNDKWCVFRMVAVPDDAENKTPYEERGWCLFETRVSFTGALVVHTFDGFKFGDDLVSPVPTKPDVFNGKIRTMKFTNGADADTVIELYQQIWPSIVSKSTPLEGFQWGDAQAEEFLGVLPELTNLKEVDLRDWKGSDEMKEQLSQAMRERGGEFRLH